MLVSPPGIEPLPTCSGSQSLNCWTAREVPSIFISLSTHLLCHSLLFPIQNLCPYLKLTVSLSWPLPLVHQTFKCLCVCEFIFYLMCAPWKAGPMSALFSLPVILYLSLSLIFPFLISLSNHLTAGDCQSLQSLSSPSLLAEPQSDIAKSW